MTKNSDRSDRTKTANPMVRADESGHAKMYNMDMTYDAETLKVNFGMRLAELRLRRNVSARLVLPSMVMLFEICDYLGVSPKEFFEFTEPEMNKLFELKLTDVYKNLGANEKEILRRIIEILERRV